MEEAIRNALVSILFAVIGFLLMIIGYRVFDMATPTNLGQKIFEEGNVAAAVLAGAFALGLAIVIAAAIH